MSPGPVLVDHFLYHNRRDHHYSYENDEGGEETPQDLVRQIVKFLLDADLISAFAATAKKHEVAKHNACKALDQTLF